MSDSDRQFGTAAVGTTLVEVTDSDVDNELTNLEEAVAQQDWTRALAVVDGDWARLFYDGHERFDRALRRIPLDRFRGHPCAMAVRDICIHSRHAGRVPEMSEVLERLAEVAAEGIGATGELELMTSLRTAAAVAVAYRVRGEQEKAIQQATVMETLGRAAIIHGIDAAMQRFPSDLLQLGITVGLAGDVPRAFALLQEAYATAHWSTYKHVRRDVASKAALLHALGGDLDRAQAWLETYRSEPMPAAGEWMARSLALTADLAEAVVAIDRLDRPAAEAAVSRLAQPIDGEKGWNVLVSYARARYALVWGDRQRGLEDLREDLSRFAPFLRGAHTLRRLLVLAEGDLLLSLSRGNQLAGIIRKDPDCFATELLGARLALLRGRWDEASALAGKGMLRSTSTRVRNELQMIQTAALCELGDAAEMRRHCVQLSDSLAVTGSRWIPASIPARLRRAVAVRCGDTPLHVRDIFAEGVELVELTRSERDVLQNLVTGRTVPAAAAELHLSPNTVKTHLRSLYTKLGVNDRREMIAAAQAADLIN